MLLEEASKTKEISVRRTYNHALVDMIATQDGVWEFICDDNTCDRAGFSFRDAIKDDNHIFLVIKSFHTFLGCVAFFRRGEGYELHTMLLPEGRGKIAKEIWKEVKKWMDDHVGSVKITTYIFDSKAMRPVRLMARLLGFSLIGKTPYSVPVHGEKVNKLVYSI